MVKSTLQDILDYTDLDENGCMIWRGGKHRQGYAMVRFRKQMRTVHSVIAELKYGESPGRYGGMRVRRTCENKMCCNPEHIIIGSSSNDKLPYWSGDKPPNGKFTDDDVRQIRLEAEQDKSWGSRTRLCKRWGCGHITLRRIITGESYRWVK